MTPVDLSVVQELRAAALTESHQLRGTPTPTNTTLTEPTPHPGVTVPVGCPNCASPMRLIDHMDAAHIPHRWRRAILECVTCRHGVLIDITLADLDNPNAA